MRGSVGGSGAGWEASSAGTRCREVAGCGDARFGKVGCNGGMRCGETEAGALTTARGKSKDAIGGDYGDDEGHEKREEQRSRRSRGLAAAANRGGEACA